MLANVPDLATLTHYICKVSSWLGHPKVIVLRTHAAVGSPGQQALSAQRMGFRWFPGSVPARLLRKCRLLLALQGERAAASGHEARCEVQPSLPIILCSQETAEGAVAGTFLAILLGL